LDLQGPCRIDLDHRKVTVQIDPKDPTLGGAPIRERDQCLPAAHVVRVRQHPSLADHNAGTHSPPLPEAYHRGSGVLGSSGDCCVDVFEDSHVTSIE
jgi:hypothetical protein